MIPILIIDDHRLFAEGLAAMLNYEVNMNVVGICTTTVAINEAIQRYTPAIVLLDINLNEAESGVKVCANILEKYPQIKVIAVSMYHEYRHIIGMKNAGAKGYLPKNCSRETFIEAIYAVSDGKIYYETSVLQGVKSLKELNSKIDLNPKERVILEKIHLGKTSRIIAEEMNVSIKTVEFYRSSLMVKFNVKNVVELVNNSQNYFG